MPRFQTLDDLDLKAGKTVLLRVDFNVPMAGGKVSDLTRIERAAPTVRELRAAGAKVLLLSHFGRPKGKVVPEMSLAPLAPVVGAVLGGTSVGFAEDCIGPDGRGRGLGTAGRRGVDAGEPALPRGRGGQ